MDKNNKNNNKKLLIFCFDISKYRRSLQFFICVGGVFFFYILYGYYQERIFQIPGFKPYGLYLTLIQFAFYTAFAALETLLISRQLIRKIPLQTYLLLAFLTVGTMGMSNASVGYLNYPTQVIFKCCKLIPVMFGGILIQGKPFQIFDFVACLLMSTGLTFFILADSVLLPNFNFVGIAMMSLALCSDAAIGNVQEKHMKASGAANTEVVLYSYGIGFFYIFGVLLVTGTLFKGIRFYATNPVQTYGYSLVFSLTGYLGITFVLTLIREFGALPAVTVTTCRKALTIFISFMMFSKPFTMQYLWSGLIVLLGIAINVYQKNRGNIHLLNIIYLRLSSLIFKNTVVRKTLQDV